MKNLASHCRHSIRQRIAALRAARGKLRLGISELRRRCLWPSVLVGALWLAALLLSEKWSEAGWVFWPSMALVAALPAFVIWLWIATVPDVWRIPGKWVAFVPLVFSAPLIVYGQIWAAQFLNRTFGEAPASFPIAYLAGSYLGVVSGFVLMATYVVFATLVVRLCLLLLRGMAAAFLPALRVAPKSYGRMFLFDLVLVALLSFTLSSALATDLHLSKALRRLALIADFHRVHHCERRDWPRGVSRVAFIGDTEVLAYLPAGDRLVVLPCHRQHGTL